MRTFSSRRAPSFACSVGSARSRATEASRPPPVLEAESLADLRERSQALEALLVRDREGHSLVLAAHCVEVLEAATAAQLASLPARDLVPLLRADLPDEERQALAALLHQIGRPARALERRFASAPPCRAGLPCHAA